MHPKGYQWTHLTASGTTITIPTTPGGFDGAKQMGRCVLHYVVINGGTVGAITIYDANSATTAVAASELAIISASTPVGTTIRYDTVLQNGLVVTLGANTDVTFVYDTM